MRRNRILTVTILMMISITLNGYSQSDEFKYQGNLVFNGQPASGNFDFEFRVFSSSVGGTQFGNVEEKNNVQVTNGVFTVSLLFEDTFDGSPRFLEIRVRPAGSGAFTTLTPRELIATTPYAWRSVNAFQAQNAVNAETAATATFAENAASALTAGSADVATTAGNVSGIVEISNGGTGSSTKNFVDLTTNQAIGGNKSFTGLISGNGSGLTSLSPSNLSAGSANIDITGSSSKSRTETTSQTPSVASLTTLILNYQSPTELTNLTDGAEGQCVTLITANGNPLITDSGIFRLASNWDPEIDDSITLCKSSALSSPKWFEVSRSTNRNFYTLTVQKTGLGGGTVTSSPGGITCGADCTEEYLDQTQVTLTATANSISVFTGWIGGGCSGTGVCAVTMSQAQTVVANFNTVPTARVTVSVTGGGGVFGSGSGISCGDVDPLPQVCSALVALGSTVTLNAFGDPGEYFRSWSGFPCVSEPTNNTCTFTLTGDVSGNASFFSQPVLFVTKSGTGTGTVTSSPSGIDCGANCTYPYAPGTLVTLTATPNAGSTFTGWSGGGCTGTGTCVVNVNQSKTVTATFNLSGGIGDFNDTIQPGREALDPVRMGRLGSRGITVVCLNGVNGVATCSSSARYKTNIVDFRSGIDVIRKLRPVTFNWTAGNALDLGLVAEEVAGIDPLLVTYNDKGEVEGVKYDRIGVVLVNTVK